MNAQHRPLQSYPSRVISQHGVHLVGEGGADGALCVDGLRLDVDGHRLCIAERQRRGTPGDQGDVQPILEAMVLKSNPTTLDLLHRNHSQLDLCKKAVLPPLVTGTCI